MGENTKIEWCDHTINWWWGCTKVSPACANCYAERQDARFLGWPRQGDEPRVNATHWGPDAPRLVRVEAAAKEAMRFQRKAEREGTRFRVFTNSMADFFEDRRDLDGARLESLDVIRRTPSLDWLILTKRPERIISLLERAQRVAQGQGDLLDSNPALAEWLGWWLSGKAPMNVWLGTTVEDQERADQRVPALLQVPVAVRFLSCEPLLGPIDLGLRDCWLGYTPTRDLLHQVIAGGESGPKARPSHPDWFRGLRDQCAAEGVPFLFKQWGEWAPNCLCPTKDPHPTAQRPVPGLPGCMFRCGKARAGRLLDGVEHNGYPEVR